MPRYSLPPCSVSQDCWAELHRRATVSGVDVATQTRMELEAAMLERPIQFSLTALARLGTKPVPLTVATQEGKPLRAAKKARKHSR